MNPHAATPLILQTLETREHETSVLHVEQVIAWTTGR